MLVHSGSLLHRQDHFWGWRPPAQNAVRALAVIVLAPLFDDDLGLLQCVEDFAVEQLVPEAGVEALDIAVLPRRPWGDVCRLRSHGADPVPHFLGDELRAIVGANECRRPQQDEEVRQHVQHIDGVQLPVDTDRQRLPRELIDDVQRSVGPPFISPVLEEVIGSDMVRILWPEADARPLIQLQVALLRLLGWNIQPLAPPGALLGKSMLSP